MRCYVADLHVHSLLSPCAAVEMTPRNIILHAEEYGIDIIAITDHNACDNVQAALQAAEGTSVVVLPGMEVETKEEIHLLVLFQDIRQLQEWASYISDHLSGRMNDEKRLGAQFIVNADDELIAVKEEMLLTSLKCGIADVTKKVSEIGGICIASHIDRPVYSIISQLGFIPEDVVLAAVEVSRCISLEDAREKFSALVSLPIIKSSDAHTIDDFIHGPKTIFYLNEPTLQEISQAFIGENSRKVVI